MTINAVPVTRANRGGLPPVVRGRGLPTTSPSQSREAVTWEVSPDEVPANPFARSPRNSSPSPSPVTASALPRNGEDKSAQHLFEEVSPDEVPVNPFVARRSLPLRSLPFTAANEEEAVEGEAQADTPVRHDGEGDTDVFQAPVKPSVRKIRKARSPQRKIRRKNARTGGIVLKPEDEAWLRFIAVSRYVTVRHIQVLEGDEYSEYYEGVNQRTKDKAELRALKRERTKALRDAKRIGTDYEVRQHDARIAEFEEYLTRLDAHLNAIKPPTGVRDRLDKLERAGYLRKRSYTGINTVYWITQKAADVFDLDAPVLGDPSEGQLGHTLAIAYLSALVRSGLKTFGAGHSPRVILTETEIRRQAKRMSVVDPDRPRLVQWHGASQEGFGAVDPEVALSLADHYVAASHGDGIHTPDLVLIFDPEEMGSGDSHSVIAIEVERTRKNKRELHRVLLKYRDSRTRFQRVFYLIPFNASDVKSKVANAIEELGLGGYVQMVEYDPMAYNATMTTW